MRRPITLTSLALIAVLWVTALSAAPEAAAPRVSAAIYAAGSLVCHQQSDRSFHRSGAQFPVCARCFGLYVGGLLGIIGWAAVAGLRARPVRRAERWVSPTRTRLLLVLVALPTIISVTTAWLGWWDPPNMLRAALAVPLGWAIGGVVAAVAAGDMR